MKRQLLIFICLVTAIYAANAQFDRYDRVAYYLEKRNLEYEQLYDNEGEYSIDIKLGNGRNQTGFIDSRISYDSDGNPYREIVSLVYIDEALPSKADLYQVLHLNAKLDRGAFQINQVGDNYVIRYLYKISADFTETAVINALYYAVTVADQLERELSAESDLY